MSIRRHKANVTTEYGGDAEAYSPRISGKLVSVRYVKDDFENGVDFVLTSENTGATIWSEDDVNASATRYPRVATQTTAGGAATYNGTQTVNGKILLAQDRVKIEVADGGNETSGTFHFTIED
jgi:hypothetical protein